MTVSRASGYLAFVNTGSLCRRMGPSVHRRWMSHISELPKAESDIKDHKITAPDTAKIGKLLEETFKIQNVLCRISLFCESKGSQSPDWPTVLGVNGQDTLISVARFMATNDPALLAQTIHHYKIEDANTRFELLKLCMSQVPEEVCKNFKNFGFSTDEGIDLNRRNKTAEILFGIDPKLLCHYIKVFEVDDYTRTGLAISAGLNDHLQFVSHIKNFNLTEGDRIRVAMFLAHYKDSSISPHIHLYEIRDQQAKFKIAMLEVRKTKFFLENFHNYEFTDSKMTLEVLKVAVPIDPDHVRAHIDQYKLDLTGKAEILRLVHECIVYREFGAFIKNNSLGRLQYFLGNNYDRWCRR